MDFLSQNALFETEPGTGRHGDRIKGPPYWVAMCFLMISYLAHSLLSTSIARLYDERPDPSTIEYRNAGAVKANCLRMIGRNHCRGIITACSTSDITGITWVLPPSPSLPSSSG